MVGGPKIYLPGIFPNNQRHDRLPHSARIVFPRGGNKAHGAVTWQEVFLCGGERGGYAAAARRRAGNCPFSVDAISQPGSFFCGHVTTERAVPGSAASAGHFSPDPDTVAGDKNSTCFFDHPAPCLAIWKLREVEWCGKFDEFFAD